MSSSLFFPGLSENITFLKVYREISQRRKKVTLSMDSNRWMVSIKFQEIKSDIQRCAYLYFIKYSEQK